MKGDTMIRVITLIVVVITSTISNAQSDQQLMDRYDKLYASGKYELALKAAELIVDRNPESATWNFFTGALLAKLGREQEAIEHLRICAENHYSGISSFEQISDLDSLRELEDFKEIIETVRATAQARIKEFQAVAKHHKPKSYFPEESVQKPMLIIALHGTGMNGQSMFDALIETAKNQSAILIAPDALRPAGRGFSWTFRDESKWFVNYLIDDAIKNHNADPNQVVLIGFSQGANIALILGQTQPESFLAVVPVCGHYEDQIAKSTAEPAPFYLISGSRDPWKNTYSKARRDFVDSGGEVQMRILAGKGHELPSGPSGTKEYTKAILWARKQLKSD